MTTVADALRELRQAPLTPWGTPDATQHGRSTMAKNQRQPCPAEAVATQAIIVTHGIQRTERAHGGRFGEEVTQ